MTTKSQLSARPGRVKTKQRNLKQRATARPALGRSRRRRKPAALANIGWALLNLCDAVDHGTKAQIKEAVTDARSALKD